MKVPEDDPLLDSNPTSWCFAGLEGSTENMAGFSEREEEEFLLIHGPRKVRKAIKERRKAREQTQKGNN